VKRLRSKIIEEPMEAIYLGKESDIEESSEERNQLDVLKTAISFVEKINEHDVNGIAELMTDDHTFIDSMGIVMKGKKKMKTAWEGYLSWIPDYEITVVNTLLTGDSVGLFGTAKGMFAFDEKSESNKFEIPAAWRAKVKDKLISEWQVFADNESVRNIINENGVKAMIKASAKGDV
jgi:uncharacterized protein (TIGR02246 family)